MYELASNAPRRVDSLLVTDGKIRGAGDASGIRELARKTGAGRRGPLELRLYGRTVIPAFFDAHMHFYQMVAGFSALSLANATSLEEALERTREFTAKKPMDPFYLAREFDESGWPGKRFPSREELDDICPTKPLVWRRICGHVAVANTAALEVVGREKEFPDYELDDETGVLLENAVDAADRLFRPSNGEMERNLTRAAALALSLGVCGMGEIVGVEGARCYLRSIEMGGSPGLHTRINIAVNNRAGMEEALDLIDRLQEEWSERRRGRDGAPDMGFTTGIKLFADGSFGARTAALTGDYADRKGERGRLLHSDDELTELIASADARGLSVMVHAIGDAAIEQVISAYERVLGKMEASGREKETHHKGETHRHQAPHSIISGANLSNPLRHSIEHLELPSRSHIERAARMGLIAGIQPNFASNWAMPGGMNERRLGKERAARSDPVGSIAGRLFTAFGSDGMPFSPLYGIKGAVKHPVKRERISLFEAVKCYTINAAYSAGLDGITGSIRPAKRADMVILSGRLTPETLDSMEVDTTICGGEVVYERSTPKTAPGRR